MGRLKALVLHAQQTHATRDATAQQGLLHVAPPRECDTQQSRTPAGEAEIVDWLTRVGERDPQVVRETLDKCRVNPDALRFFLGLARGDHAGSIH